MGVGRPALSNLLNGNAALSAEMAARIEKAFNYPREELLHMQAEYEAAEAKKKIAPAVVKAYVPPFLSIKANQIEQWCAHNIPARARLSVFLRTLVHSTGRALAKVDFPGNDDAERPRWDGYVVSDEGTPWVPLGPSGWEYGVNEDVKTKAEGDFNKSVKALSPEERDRQPLCLSRRAAGLGKVRGLQRQRRKAVGTTSAPMTLAISSNGLSSRFLRKLGWQTRFTSLLRRSLPRQVLDGLGQRFHATLIGRAVRLRH